MRKYPYLRNQPTRGADWEYALHARPGGVIVIHDTAVHNGPVQLVDLIDRTRMQVFKFGDDRADDWGITICQKL